MLEANTTVYGQYSLARRIEATGDHELWEARDEYGGPMLVKAWPYKGDKPNDEERALWNLELRHLFRLASLPDAEEHLVVLKDAGIDTNRKYFVMALMAPGLRQLDDLLREKVKCDWLQNVRSSPVRAELWRGLRRLALGLVQLHQEQMLHRAISPRSVFVDRDRGPSTMRLGGFEWTVRLGGSTPPGVPPLPAPEGAYSFESDWFLLGMLAARIVAAKKELPTLPEVLATLRGAQILINEERELIEQLLTSDPTLRLSRGYEVIQRIGSILAILDAPTQRRPEDYLALLVLLGPQRPLTLAIIEQDESITALDTEDQRKFIEDDLSKPRIVRRPGPGLDGYTLLGNRLRYSLTEYLRHDASRGSWDIAHCAGPTELRASVGDNAQVALERIPIKVFTLRAFEKDETVVRRAAVSWKPFLPSIPLDTAERDRAQQRFYDFFRVTNQIELLMRDAEIFAYEIRNTLITDGAEEVFLYAAPRSRDVLAFAKLVEGMIEFLNREKDEKRDGNLVYIGNEQALDLGREVPRTEFWAVVDADPDSGIVTLRRPTLRGGISPPQQGFLRAFGLFGQMSLIRRRKRAIERLANHAYLLRALERPDFVFLDTGDGTLPRPVDPDKIDAAKQTALSSIWRTRPIFALQGPPGTGKTTLVANLLGQIFKDDPVAQVLVTAQAHAAVDVLREKVSDELTNTDNQPLSIRFPKTKGDETQDPDYVEAVTYRMLARSLEKLGEKEQRTSIQGRWLEVARTAMLALQRHDTEGHARDLCELVRRSAGITYCTTTAGNLEELADSTQTFDWSIIEEAGKAHGFDLVLPLQTGHRWLLIGDQKQLYPYRIENFRNALLQLDSTFEALRALPQRGGNLVDIDLALRWQRYDDGEKSWRKDSWLSWLRFFETLHIMCSRAKGPESMSHGDAAGAPVLAQMLSHQHRMHPTIAELVSRAYYKRALDSETIGADGRPIARVVHPFVKPDGISGRAIVWLDTAWVGDGGVGETGPEDGGGRYTSSPEIAAIESFLSLLQSTSDQAMSVAILSPYRRQVTELNQRVKGLQNPAWKYSRTGGLSTARRSLAATVDSFQGDQADVVVVSLVRNNNRQPGSGLGFLREEGRMNVLFSRAERLLVLVGSWEFFQRQLEGVPPDDTQPLGHWRIAVDYLASCFDSGLAVRLADTSLR